MHVNKHYGSLFYVQTSRDRSTNQFIPAIKSIWFSNHRSRPGPVSVALEEVSQPVFPGKNTSTSTNTLPDSITIHRSPQPTAIDQRVVNSVNGSDGVVDGIDGSSEARSTSDNDSCSPIRFYYQNVRGLKSKIDDFFLACLEVEYDVIVLVETWLDERINSVQLFGNSFNVFRMDRNHKNSLRKVGGGVLIAVRKVFDSCLCTEGMVDSLEQVFVQISVTDCTIFVGCFYLPCEKCGDRNLMASHVSCIEKVRERAGIDDIIVVTGDYNQPNLVWSCTTNGNNFAYPMSVRSGLGQQYSSIEVLLDGVARCNLIQCSTIRNYNQRQLDLIFVSDRTACSVTTTVDPLVIFTLENIEYLKYEDVVNPGSLNYRRINFTGLTEGLELTDWSAVLSCTDVEESINQFGLIVNNLLMSHTPRFKPSPKPPWSNGRLRNLKTKCSTALRRYSSKRCMYSKTQFKEACSAYRAYNRQRYAGYVRRIQEQLRRNPRMFWSFVKSKHKEDGLPLTMSLGTSTASTNETKCKLFVQHFASAFGKAGPENPSNEFLDTVPADLVDVDCFFVSEEMLFRAAHKLKSSYTPGPDGLPAIVLKRCIQPLSTPLLKIFRLSMEQAKFPAEWKKSYMFPVFKKGEKRSVRNYRGITSLCAGSKLLAIIVSEVIRFSCRSYIAQEQHGFVPGRSVHTNLMEFITFCIDNTGSGNQVDAIYTDLKSAFDRIEHDIALKKFAKLGFSSSLCRWLESYLKDRILQVKVGSSLSNVFVNETGVPQGSNLGPLLFVLFFNDVTVPLDGRCKLVYADDLKIYIVVESLDDHYVVQSLLNKFYDWCKKNRMTISIEKCIVISFHRKLSREIFYFDYRINDQKLERVECVKDLGVLIDSRLTFRNHQSAVIDKANRQLGFMFKIARDSLPHSHNIKKQKNIFRCGGQDGSNDAIESASNRLSQYRRTLTTATTERSTVDPFDPPCCCRPSSKPAVGFNLTFRLPLTGTQLDD
ncbi:uncharacterized protein LOC129773254 [Toxorhynchites rutilus septentrionalis]|uniref:uncharacterized protein LOC129773254 n=1 Tax=Toxorhynchites rutilus septentrionalis TaxID=329112 RepID=UPI00247ADF94|nr:uncharacterized protein LOC129773254 [Toxorhynchites rutilus septentrionalis]